MTLLNKVTTNTIHFSVQCSSSEQMQVVPYTVYRQNILISRLYEQFSRNDSAKAPHWLQKKISNFKNMNILYISLNLKLMIWRSR